MSNIESLLVEIRDLLVLMTEQKKTKKRKSKVEADNLYTPDFEEMWRHYPKKASKRESAKAYRNTLIRLRLASGETHIEAKTKILGAVKAYKEVWPPSRVKSEGKFCLHLSTFLNQDRFEDDPNAWSKEDTNEGIGGPKWVDNI
jgi:hypothetical protein